MLAAREAVDDARLDLNTLRVGLISSTSVGGMDLSEHFYNAFKKTIEKEDYGKLSLMTAVQVLK